ncbi:unnamed protein product [Lathyrus oleraceus]|uniref:uncharacterized protein LOC127119610 n=1 Tax=Pisum sativum TaxID=3888 RepID=UPI001FC5268C|nr:uncharacterized protein LOC127119610 [Pisum sativum]
MQKEQEYEENVMDSLLCPSFSTYSSNNLNDVAEQVINENDHSHSQNDKDDFEFVAFRKTADEVFFDHRRRNSIRGVFPIFNRDDEKINSVEVEISVPLRELMNSDCDRRNSDVAEDSIPLQKLNIRDGHRRNSDAVDMMFPLRKVYTEDQKRDIDHPSSSSSDVGGDLDEVSPASYCLWTPKSPTVSPMSSPIKCNKSNSTGSSSNSSSSKRWKFLSLLRRCKSDGKESLILVSPSLEFKKEAKVENSKVKISGKGSVEKNIAKVVEKKIPVTKRNIPAPVTAMEAFYLSKREIKRKAYLPYKQELIGFGVGFHANIGRGFPLHV